MAMAISMAAMMAPSATPFFFAYGRDSRRPVGVAALVLIYAAVWAAIGLVAAAVMDRLMMPGGPLIVAAALGLAVVYALMPWSRWARERCRQMCRREPRASAVREGLTYAACCVACSAGIMAALVVIGMSNIVVLVAAAGAMFAYKLI